MRRCAFASWLLLLALGCGGRALPSREIPEQSQRSVVLPERFGWVNSEHESGALPSAIGLGGKTSGRVLVYLQFPEPERGRTLLRAELWLSLAAQPSGPIDVELSRSDPAGNTLVRWSDQPHARYPRVTAKLGGSGGHQSLDVSELVRAPGKAGEPLRVLLRAEPHGGEPVLLETGSFGGSAPRLELYWE
jgi:hypothetical protein